MKKIIIAALILHVSLVSYSQNIENQIDDIFKEWNSENHPGGVLSILKGDEVIFSKAYGHANIKYNIKNTEETIFNIGSVSKQFTAMGIVLLQLEGKLSFDDDIRRFLPELYDFENKITIRHLLHHTSGFRSTPELFGLAGWRDGDAITTEDDYRYFRKQTSLNFVPGSQFMYTNSGYILLAKIIEKVTDQNFNTWMKGNVFAPLKMNNTFVDETNSNSNPKVATPYNEIGQEQLVIGENTSLDIGASNIYTTASDLTKWMKNFRSPTESFKQAFKILQTTDTLNDGKVNNYAFGVITDDLFGNERIQHTGGVPGFLSYAMYYPEQELTMILLTNFSSYSINDKYMMLSQLFLNQKNYKEEKQKTYKELPLDLEMAQSIVGDYWNVKENHPRRVYLESDTLWFLRDNGNKSPLIQINDHQYKIGGIESFVSIEFEQGEIKKMKIQEDDLPTQTFEEYDSSPLTKPEIEEYTGTYYSSELETNYKISFVNDQIIGYNNRHGEFPISVLKKDILDWSGFATVKYKRNDKNEIIGFYVNMNRVENVWFQKVEK